MFSSAVPKRTQCRGKRFGRFDMPSLSFFSYVYCDVILTIPMHNERAKENANKIARPSLLHPRSQQSHLLLALSVTFHGERVWERPVYFHTVREHERAPTKNLLSVYKNRQLDRTTQYGLLKRSRKVFSIVHIFNNLEGFLLVIMMKIVESSAVNHLIWVRVKLVLFNMP